MGYKTRIALGGLLLVYAGAWKLDKSFNESSSGLGAFPEDARGMGSDAVVKPIIVMPVVRAR